MIDMSAAEKQSILEEMLLSNLSFYEEISFGQLVVSLDVDADGLFRHLTMEDLEGCLLKLQRKRLIKVKKVKGERKIQKIFPRKALWKRLTRIISEFFFHLRNR